MVIRFIVFKAFEKEIMSVNATLAIQAGCSPSLPQGDLEKSVLDLDCTIQLPTPLKLDYTVLEGDIKIKARLLGPQDAPVLLALGGISANRHVCDVKADAQPGWWRELAGPGQILDTRAYRLLSFDFFPGDADLDGAPQNITTADQAKIARQVCDYFGIERLHAFIGSSYGGMIGLSFAAQFPERLNHLIVACAAHRPHPMGTAWRSIQRKIVRLGLEIEQPERALSLARELGMTTYRTSQEFAHRFSALPKAGQTESGEHRFEVEDYLETRGRAFIGKMSPYRYLTLSKSIDLHHVNPADIQVPVSLIGFRQDQIVPIDEIRFLHQHLPSPLNYFEFDSLYGHDAFLKESRFLGDVLKSILTP